jgi:hypothetical protein
MPALVKTWQTVDLSSRSLSWLVAAASVLLSLWAAYAQFIPNPDAMLYLRSAELFAAGRWHEAVEIFRWPLYSLGIASIMAPTGASALIAAQALNAALDAATALLFVALVSKLANDSRSVALWAGFFILLHPKLVQLRPVIIRDHGFYTFLLLTLYLVARDLQAQGFRHKAGIGAAIVLAALFRPEAAVLFLLVPAFYAFEAATSPAARWAVVTAVMLVCLLLVPAYSLWNFMGAYSSIPSGELLEVWSKITRDMFKGMIALSGHLETILPPGRNVGGLAYAGIVAAITIDIMLRALTIPIAVLVVLAFVPRRVLPAAAGRFLGWFAWWQLPLLLTFSTFALFLDWRYAMAFALLAGVPAVFTLDAAAQDALTGTWRHKLLLAGAIATIAVPFALVIPRVSNLAYLRDAGVWVRDTLPPDAKIVTNEGRIAYYSGRTYDRQIKFVAIPRLKDTVGDADYLLLHVERGSVPAIQGVDPSKQVATFNGAGDRRVIAYRLH